MGAAAGPAAGGSVVRAAWVPVAALQDAAAAGDAKAQQIIAPYRMHCDAPNDPGAFALCDAVADEWPAARRASKAVTRSTGTGASVMRPDAGSIAIDGVDVLAQPEQAKQHVSYMPQRFGLYEDLTVQENMVLAARDARRAQDLDRARLQWIFGLFPALQKFWLSPAVQTGLAAREILTWLALAGLLFAQIGLIYWLTH